MVDKLDPLNNKRVFLPFITPERKHSQNLSELASTKEEVKKLQDIKKERIEIFDKFVGGLEVILSTIKGEKNKERKRTGGVIAAYNNFASSREVLRNTLRNTLGEVAIEQRIKELCSLNNDEITYMKAKQRKTISEEEKIFLFIRDQFIDFIKKLKNKVDKNLTEQLPQIMLLINPSFKAIPIKDRWHLTPTDCLAIAEEQNLDKHLYPKTIENIKGFIELVNELCEYSINIGPIADKKEKMLFTSTDKPSGIYDLSARLEDLGNYNSFWIKTEPGKI